MRKFSGFLMLSVLVALGGCSSSKTVLVSVPPRVQLQEYGTLGLVAFDSNANPAINARVTRAFESSVHAAQPGTRIVDLGSRDALLASVGARQLDPQALRRIGEKYGIDAIFVGSLTYSEPKKADVNLADITKLEGSVRIEIRGDIDSKLVETRSGASVWSSSAWARRPLGQLNVSVDQGVSGGVRSANPREEMVPTLVLHLTEDFRASTARRRVD
jgi:hypothetical protein